MTYLWICFALALSLLSFICLYRAYIGPTAADRVVAINVINTKTIILIAVIAVLADQTLFVDVAFIYALMGFVAVVSIAKYLIKGRLD